MNIVMVVYYYIVQGWQPSWIWFYMWEERSIKFRTYGLVDSVLADGPRSILFWVRDCLNYLCTLHFALCTLYFVLCTLHFAHQLHFINFMIAPTRTMFTLIVFYPSRAATLVSLQLFYLNSEKWTLWTSDTDHQNEQNSKGSDNSLNMNKNECIKQTKEI